jgi:hypothetical protein
MILDSHGCEVYSSGSMRILFNTWPRKYAEIHLRELEESRVSLFAN